MRYWGTSGTAARYLCAGDYDAGGKYCLAFGASHVDARFGDELLRAISPLGVEASVLAMSRLTQKDAEKRQALQTYAFTGGVDVLNFIAISRA